jgi:hypothetical protein
MKLFDDVKQQEACELQRTIGYIEGLRAAHVRAALRKRWRAAARRRRRAG